MGDPKKHRKKYTTPTHPWQKDRIELEKQLSREYGLKNKKEIWKMNSFLKNIKQQAKKFTAVSTEQTKKEEQQLFEKLRRLGLLSENISLDSVLSLDLKDVLERRLQTIVVKRGLARTMKQARQFIVHRHIAIGGKKITSPSYLVRLDEESQITFSKNSSLADEMHPERNIASKGTEEKTTEKEEESKKEENKEKPEKEKHEEKSSIESENKKEEQKGKKEESKGEKKE